MEQKRFLNDSDHERLARMESEHFWYFARYRRLLRVVRRVIKGREDGVDAIDIGGGVGGWVSFLEKQLGTSFRRLVLSDASGKALKISEQIYPDIRNRAVVDVEMLKGPEKWDIVFMLDVLEYFWDDKRVLMNVASTVKIDGVIILALPAYEVFRSLNDTLNGNLRRYSPRMIRVLANSCNLDLEYHEHFMGLLSPFVLARKLWRPEYNGDEDQRNRLLDQSHKSPTGIVNRCLKMVMHLEGWLVDFVGMPLGASLFVVLRKRQIVEESR